MSNISVFDSHEEVMLNFSAFQSHLTSCKFSFLDPACSGLETLQTKFQELYEKTFKLFDQLFNSLAQERQRTEKLLKRLSRSKIKAKKYFTLQKELSSREEHIKLKNRSLTSSIKKLKNFMKREVKGLENSLKKQQKLHSQLSVQHDLNLQEIEKELTHTFESEEQSPGNSSAEFEEIMKDLDQQREENSRISIDKNPGGWESDLESSMGSKCEAEDVKNAISVLLKANLIHEDNSLYRLSKFFDENPESENVELVLQLVDIKMKGKVENLLDTTPMSSILMNESDILQTLISPCYKSPSFFVDTE